MNAKTEEGTNSSVNVHSNGAGSEINAAAIVVSDVENELEMNVRKEEDVNNRDNGHNKGTGRAMNATGILVPDVELEINAGTEEERNSATNGHGSISRRKWRTCSVKGCGNNTSTQYAFPKIINKKGNEQTFDHSSLLRVFIWLQATGNRDLLIFSPVSLHKKVICANHFDEDQFRSTIAGKLKPTAQPRTDTLLSDEDMSLYKNHFCYLPGLPVQECIQTWTDVERCLEFEQEMKQLCYFTCIHCKEKQLKMNHSRTASSCSHREKCFLFSDHNNMDPGIVPPELQGLTFTEEQLIARVHPMLSVFKLQPGQQLGYSGNIISFPQDIQPFASELPHKLQDINSVLSLKFENQSGNTHYFRVRKKKVYDALVFLSQNHIFYKDVKISRENLESLPDDGNVEHLFSVQAEESHGVEVEDTDTSTAFCASSNNPEQSLNVNEGGDDQGMEQKQEYVHETCVPNFTLPHPDEQIEATLNWPKLDAIPINEFKTPGYIACAFPTLFPYGKADLRDNRLSTINPSEYFKHLLLYEDKRFAQHSTFRFFAMNSTMRWTALTDGNIFLRNHPEFKNMTASQLKDLIKEKPETFKKIMYMTSNLRGSKQYWCARCNELKQMVEQIGLPTIFLTLSFADYHYKG